MDLKEIRTQIDNLDRQIIDLLQRRMNFAVRAMIYKDIVCDPLREKTILENVLSQKSEQLDSLFITDLYRLIIDKSKELQERKLHERQSKEKIK